MTKEELEEKLIIGAKIKIGDDFAEYSNMKAGEIIELVEGSFEYDNGLYTETELCPAIFDEKRKDFDSIYHLFGNDLEDFMDCEILN